MCFARSFELHGYWMVPSAGRHYRHARLQEPRFLICDRDGKWSAAVRRVLESSSVRVIRIPFRAPNCSAHAERFIRSTKKECFDRLIPLGEQHFRRALAEFVAHYHGERNHQGSATTSSTPQMIPVPSVLFFAANASADFSATTIVRPHRDPRVRVGRNFWKLRGSAPAPVGRSRAFDLRRRRHPY